jgi:transposase-like protein
VNHAPGFRILVRIFVCPPRDSGLNLLFVQMGKHKIGKKCAALPPRRRSTRVTAEVPRFVSSDYDARFPRKVIAGRLPPPAETTIRPADVRHHKDLDVRGTEARAQPTQADSFPTEVATQDRVQRRPRNFTARGPFRAGAKREPPAALRTQRHRSLQYVASRNTDPVSHARWLVAAGLVNDRCRTCDHRMEPRAVPNFVDGAVMVCREPSCPKKHANVSMKVGTVMANSKLPLSSWMAAAACYDTDATVSQAAALCGCTRQSTHNMFRCFDGVVAQRLADDPILFDGWHPVEFDEGYAVSKRKYNRGTLRPYQRSGRWLFGMAERWTGRVAVVVVPDRKLTTLRPIIEERIAAGALTVSDEFSSYNFMCRAGYKHRTVNHSEEEYVRYDPDGLEVHPNTIEGFWSHFKVALRRRRGTRRHDLETFARVRSWRTLKESIFALICTAK